MRVKENSTKHSAKRAEERMDLNHRRSDKVFKKALLYGKRSTDLYGRAYKKLEDKSDENTEAVYYNKYIFLFSNEQRCITVYQAPKYFSGKYCGKDHIKSIVKYNKLENGDLGRRKKNHCMESLWDYYDDYSLNKYSSEEKITA